MVRKNDPGLDKILQALRKQRNKLTQSASRLASAAFGLIDETISHEECKRKMYSYVVAEVDGEHVATLYPKVKQHIDLCDKCYREYFKMVSLTLAERAGEIPAVVIPEPKLGFLHPVPSERQPVVLPFPDLVRQIALDIAQGLRQISDALLLDKYQMQLQTVGVAVIRRKGAERALETEDPKYERLGDAREIVAATMIAMDRLASLPLDDYDDLVAKNRLASRAEQQAIVAAIEIHAKAALARDIGRELGPRVTGYVLSLRAEIERRKGAVSK